MILKRLHLKLGKKAMEKLMKLKPPWKAAACAEGGTLSHLPYWNLLHTILDAAGLRNRLDIQLRGVCLISCFSSQNSPEILA